MDDVQKVNYDNEKSYENVSFNSQGARLRGRLYLVKNASSKPSLLIMAHGFSTTVKGMTADKYAEAFNKAGFAVLLYDHRNLGLSDGLPRQEINFWVQARGYIDCIDFALTLKEIDHSKIAIWGCSSSAREVFIVGSIDDRVKAIVTQVPAFGANFLNEDTNGEIFSQISEIVLSDNIQELDHNTSESIPVVSADPKENPAAVPTISAYNWFTKYGEVKGSKWQNKVTISRPVLAENFHVAHCAKHIKAPIIMVVAMDDEIESANARVSHEIYQSISQPKEFYKIKGGHFGLLYYPSPIFDQASKAQIRFLKKHLT